MNDHTQFSANNPRALARAISLVENEAPGYESILFDLPATKARLIGITGAPGSGKSSLTDSLIAEMISDGKTVAVLCVDPSSPFNKGAVLGDRIRMSKWYEHPSVFIRSLASRGSLGGLHPHIIEISDLVQSSGFDYVIIETVGVGQSEVDIAALADTTVVVLVPEGGDVIQTMKAGLMEIADVFVVNKSDRPGADTYYNTLKKMIGPRMGEKPKNIPVLKTIATSGEGVNQLYLNVKDHGEDNDVEKRVELLTHKAWLIIQQQKMRSVDKDLLREKIAAERGDPKFNIYRFARSYTK